MDTYIQTGLGIVVSLILFFIGYRQTIGAKKERAKNANHSIHRAILRRMVLEEYSPKLKDVTKLIEGKAREFQVSINDLLAEEQILNSLFTEVFDSDLISPSQRVEIEKRIDSCFKATEHEETFKPTFIEFQQLEMEKKKKSESLTWMVATTSIIGASSTLAYGLIEKNAFNLEWIMSGIGVLVASVFMLSVISTYKRNKENYEAPSRRAVQVVSSAFEAELVKLFEKQNIKYVIEPAFGRLRPDFLVEINGKKIAVEAKAWSGNMPLHQIKRTLDYLNELTSYDGIDRAILVTRGKSTIPISNTVNEKISIVPHTELIAELKKAA